MRQRKVVNTARSSSTLMCSFAPCHLQPHIVLHFHKLAGILARNGFFRERYGFAGIFIIFCAKTEDGKKNLELRIDQEQKS